jgi:hypothetical protein
MVNMTAGTIYPAFDPALVTIVSCQRTWTGRCRHVRTCLRSRGNCAGRDDAAAAVDDAVILAEPRDMSLPSTFPEARRIKLAFAFLVKRSAGRRKACNSGNLEALG